LKTILNLLIAVVVFAMPTKVNASTVEFLNSKPANAKLPFSEAVKVDSMLYLSGQIGINPETKKLASGGVEAEAHQTLRNIKRVLNSHKLDMSNVVKCLVILTDINDFAAFNSVYVQYFKAPYPARSAFAAKELALGAKVEIECMAAF